MLYLPWAELIGFLVLFDLFTEDLLALLTGHNQLRSLFELMVLAFFVALGTIEPLSTAGSSDGHLGVEDMLAHFCIVINLNL